MMQAWNVYEGGKKIDTVRFDSGMTSDEVRRSLIHRDGLSPAITVKKKMSEMQLRAMGDQVAAEYLRRHGKPRTNPEKYPYVHGQEKSVRFRIAKHDRVETRPVYAGSMSNEIRHLHELQRMPFEKQRAGFRKGTKYFSSGVVDGRPSSYRKASKKNPASGGADMHAARDLELCMENNWPQIFRQQLIPIQKNLIRKIIAGKYDQEKAVKLWMYYVETGAKLYMRDFASARDRIDSIFNKNTRLVVARSLAATFERQFRDNDFSHSDAEQDALMKRVKR